MATPVSIGDAITILNQIYQIYDAYRNTPDRLRQAMKKFENAEREMEALNTILANSRRPEHRSYPHTAELVSDLRKARDYFQKYEPLVDTTGKIRMVSRVKRTVRANWDWGEVMNHISVMDVHRDNMKDFKQTVLIQAAQDNIELQISAIKLQLNKEVRFSQVQTVYAEAQDNVSFASSDHISVLTKASKSLSIARQLKSVPEQRHSLGLSPVLEPNELKSNDLKKTIAEYVEREELYRQDAMQIASVRELQHVAELPARWMHRQQDAQAQGSGRHRAGSHLSRPLPSPQSSYRLNPSFEPTSPHKQQLDCEAASISPSWREALKGVRLDARETIRSFSTTESLPGPAVDLDAVSIADTRISDSSEGTDEELVLSDTVMLYTPWTGNAPVTCGLKMIKSAGSLCVKSTTTQAFPLDTMLPAGSRLGASPSTILDMRRSISVASDANTLTFNHAVLGGMGSFPRILHPRAEGRPTPSHTHPYTIEFYSHQFVSVEGHGELAKAVRGIAYQFRRKEDRDMVRERIFGKKLLASAGISTIQFDKKNQVKPCGTQAMSLWTTEQNERPNLSITIQCSSKGGAKPDCAVEFIVVKAKNIEKVRDYEGRELEIEIHPAPVEEEASAIASASGAILSSNASDVSYVSDVSQSNASTSPRTRKSSILTFSRRSSMNSATTLKAQESFHCYVRFTEGSEDLTQSKRKFLNALKAYLKASEQ